MALGLVDWALVGLLALVLIAAGSAIAVAMSRRHTDREIDALHSRLRSAEHELRSLSRPRPDTAPGPQARTEWPLPHPTPAHKPVPESLHEPGAEPQPVRPTAEGLTQAAALALNSISAFRRFAATAGGCGFVVTPGTQSCQPVNAPDEVSAADIWAVSLEDATLYFPGWNLLRSQSSLLAGSGRPARDRLGWLFDIEAGEQLAARRPASQRPGEPIERGVLTLPF